MDAPPTFWKATVSHIFFVSISPHGLWSLPSPCCPTEPCGEKRKTIRPETRPPRLLRAWRPGSQLFFPNFSHHLEAMGHGLLEFTGEPSETRVPEVAQDFGHPQ